MSTEPGRRDGTARSAAEPPADVVRAARDQVAGQEPPARAAWLDRFVWSVLWKVVAVGLAVTVLLFAAYQARHLIALLVVSTFFALALVPAINTVHRRWGWRRGAAVGAIYGAGLVFLILLVVVLIPGIVQFADAVNVNAPGWIGQLNELSHAVTGTDVIDADEGAGTAALISEAMSRWGQNVLGALTSGVGTVFDLFTIASFTFYIAVDFPRLRRALMSRMPPAKQRAFGWVTDASIEQTGGYFYSRMLLLLVNGGLSLVVMLLIGLPLTFALPMAVFIGFFAEFIPVIGTYVGAAVPIALTLAVKGLGSAVILLAWVIVYQQVENLWLSPKVSAHTMELNGAVAFGAALAGGAIAGPMGAFMALPVAALITAVVKNTGRTYDVVYHARYETDDDRAAAVPRDPEADAGPRT